MCVLKVLLIHPEATFIAEWGSRLVAGLETGHPSLGFPLDFHIFLSHGTSLSDEKEKKEKSSQYATHVVDVDAAEIRVVRSGQHVDAQIGRRVSVTKDGTSRIAFAVASCTIAHVHHACRFGKIRRKSNY